MIPVCLRVSLLVTWCSMLAVFTNGNCAFICLFIYRLRDIVFKELSSGQHVCLWYCILRTLSGCSLICTGRSANGVTFQLRLLAIPDYLYVRTIYGKSGLYHVFVCLSVVRSVCKIARRRYSTWQHTTLKTDKRPCPRWDWNSQSQQASGCRPTP